MLVKLESEAGVNPYRGTISRFRDRPPHGMGHPDSSPDMRSPRVHVCRARTGSSQASRMRRHCSAHQGRSNSCLWGRRPPSTPLNWPLLRQYRDRKACIGIPGVAAVTRGYDLGIVFRRRKDRISKFRLSAAVFISHCPAGRNGRSPTLRLDHTRRADKEFSFALVAALWRTIPSSEVPDRAQLLCVITY